MKFSNLKLARCNLKRIVFIEMMGVPGSYDASVYNHFEDRDQEGLWFIKRFGNRDSFTIATCNVCLGDTLPEPLDADAFVLAGSYNSVHDQTDWQEKVTDWLPRIRAHRIPILAICGSHQLLAHTCGSDVERIPAGPYAGTFEIAITDHGKASPLFHSIENMAGFQFANNDRVLNVPEGAKLMASSGPVDIAALDYGNHCYSTQFHPEGTWETLSTVWRNTSPDLMENYYAEENGRKLVNNFLNLVISSDLFDSTYSE